MFIGKKVTCIHFYMYDVYIMLCVICHIQIIYTFLNLKIFIKLYGRKVSFCIPNTTVDLQNHRQLFVRYLLECQYSRYTDQVWLASCKSSQDHTQYPYFFPLYRYSELVSLMSTFYLTFVFASCYKLSSKSLRKL